MTHLLKKVRPVACIMVSDVGASNGPTTSASRRDLGNFWDWHWLVHDRHHNWLWPRRHSAIYVGRRPEEISQAWPSYQDCQVGKPFISIVALLTTISTWRSLIPVLEDRPLALCDARSVLPNDLIATDRVIPTMVGEVYYLHYNPDHKWCVLKVSSFIGTLMVFI